MLQVIILEISFLPNEIFKHTLKEPSLNTPWSRDMRKIFTQLHVVDNNGPEQIGGGGDPIGPLAPPFSPNSTDNLDDNKVSIAIWPNPAVDDQLQVRWSQPSPALWLLYDVNGRMVYSHQLMTGQQTLALPALPAGVYTWQVWYLGEPVASGRQVKH